MSHTEMKNRIPIVPLKANGAFTLIELLVVIAIIAIAAFMPQQTWLNGSKLAPYFLSAANQVSAGAPAELRLKIQQGVAVIEHVPPTWIQLHLHPPPATR